MARSSRVRRRQRLAGIGLVSIAVFVMALVDTGIGLSVQQLDGLFEPFSRPNDGLGSGPRGTGLGLFLAKAIIEHHGGRIWAESRGAGQGASFCFALPLKRLPGPQRAKAVGHGAQLSLRGEATRGAAGETGEHGPA